MQLRRPDRNILSSKRNIELRPKPPRSGRIEHARRPECIFEYQISFQARFDRIEVNDTQVVSVGLIDVADGS